MHGHVFAVDELIERFFVCDDVNSSYVLNIAMSLVMWSSMLFWTSLCLWRRDRRSLVLVVNMVGHYIVCDAVRWSTLHCLCCCELIAYLIIYIDGILIVFDAWCRELIDITLSLMPWVDLLSYCLYRRDSDCLCLWGFEMIAYLIVCIDGILIVHDALRWSPISLSVSTRYWLSLIP